MLPYGMTNFAEIIEEGYVYIDKTKYIEILEKYPRFQFFIRPRRFGKSLFISMLESYYDINKKAEFEKLFKDLYIGENPTKNRNSYLVLTLSFAHINSTQGKVELIESFDRAVTLYIASFMRRYKEYFQDNIEINDAVSGIRYISMIAKEQGKKIFILIDEYDNFANDLINNNESLYKELLSAEGYVRTFYKALKDSATESISRIFMTGVSPIMLDDLTSGFNITSNLTLQKNLNEIMGFTEKEVRYMIKAMNINSSFDEDKLIEDMRIYYNGYKFNSMAENRVYNPDMVLYFLQELYINDSYPKQMIDNNVKTDYGKLNKMAFNFKNDDELLDIIASEEVEVILSDRFNLEYMFNNKENFKSLLYYMGMLTIKKEYENKLILKIPNYVIKTVYWEYLRNKISEDIELDNKILDDTIRAMRKEGKIESFIDFIANILHTLSNRDLQKFDEKYIKCVMASLLILNNMYIINSELEVEAGYVDLLLTKNGMYKEYIDYEWLIELKYIKESDRENSENIKLNAVEQLKSYVESKKIMDGFSEGYLKKVVVVVVGKKDIYVEYV